MRKTFLLILLALLAAQAQAVRYGLKKQAPIDSVTVMPEYLAYSKASQRMYCGGTWSSRVYWFDCLTDEPQGQVSGAKSPAPMAYDSVNNRIYYKGGDEFFYAIDCAANALDTTWGGYQGGTLAEYNAVNNKIYLWDDFNDQTLIHSAADYSYLGLLSPWKGPMHHFGPSNTLYVPHAWLDSLGAFNGATDAMITSIYLPGLSSNFGEKMASSPGSSRLYLSLPNTDQVAIVNTATNTLLEVKTVGDNPVNLALCPLNNRMFIACNGSSQHSLQFINLAGVLDSVAVGDSVSVVAYNPKDSLIYIGCQRTGQIKLVDPRLPTPLVVDSVNIWSGLRYADMKADQDGDVYVVASNYSDMFVVGQLPPRIWRSEYSGWWSDYMTWNYSDDGGNTWQTSAMMETPNCATDSTVLIQAGHNIIVSNPVVLDQLVVNGALEQSADVTVNDGPGDDIVVDNGVYQRQSGTLTANAGATMSFGPFSQYVHNMDGGNIPAASWDSLSTLSITGVMTAMPSGMDQAFGNIAWDGTQQAIDVVLPGGPSFSARDVYINSTGPNNVCLTSAAKPELVINNLFINTGTVLLGSGGNRKLRLLGDLSVWDPGWLNLTDTLNPGIDTLFLHGDYYHLAAGIRGGGPDSTVIVFCGTDTQAYNSGGEILVGYVNYQVNPGAFLRIQEFNTLGNGTLGDFTLMPGATLGYSNYQGIYPSGQDTGVVRNLGARNFSQGANYYLYGISTGPYATGPGIPDTVNQLIVESSLDQAYISKDLAVMDTLKLLGNNLRIDGRRLSLFGPIYQTSGNLIGNGASQLAIMGGSPLPVSLPGMFRDVGTLSINRPATVAMTDTLLVYNRLELINGTLNNGGNKLTFQNASVISRSGNGSLAGAGPTVFVNQAGLEYGAGVITAGPEMPISSTAILYLALKGSTDTLIVDRDTLNVWNNLSVSGGIRFKGKSFSSYGLIDTMGPAGELILSDTGKASLYGSSDPLYLPGITGGSLLLDNSGGIIMRRNISCTGPLTLSTGGLTVGSHRLVLSDSLSGTGALTTDSTSSLVFQGNAVNQILPSSVNHLGYLAWNRPATLFAANPLVLHDSLKLGQGTVDNSVNLSLRSGTTIFRNFGSLSMPPVLEGPVDVVYGSHGGGTLPAGNELPTNATDLHNLYLGLGALPNDTVALTGPVRINGRLSLYQGALDAGGRTLTLCDTIEAYSGQLVTNSGTVLEIINTPHPFTLPASVGSLLDLYIDLPGGGINLAGPLTIGGTYTQNRGHLLSGTLQYGPTATLAYTNPAGDTTTDREFPAVNGPYILSMAGSVQLQLHADRTVPGSVFLNGVINTGANTLTIDTTGTVMATMGYVDGNLAKLIPFSADTTIAYELGTAAGGPSPAEIRAFNNTVPAFVTAGIRSSGHSLVSDSSACLKKHWTFSGAGLGADACQITLHYLPGDFNSPGFEEALHESTMAAGRYDPPYSAWQLPGIIARNIYGTADGGSIVLAHSGNFNDSPEFTLGRDSASIVNLALDTTLPYIASSLPLDGAIGVGLTDSVLITFSEPVRKSAVSYTFLPNPGTVDTAWSTDSTTMVFNHSPFAGLTSYTVKVLGVQDTAGNLLTGRDSVWFTTMDADTAPPYIVSSLPLDGAIGVGLADSVLITFSEPVRKSAVSYTFLPNPGTVDTAWSADSTTMVFNHSPFAGLTSYTVKVLGVQDTAGNLLTGRDSVWFTTMDADTAPPYIVSTQPAAWASGVALDAAVSVTFSEPINPAGFAYSFTPDPGGLSVVWSADSITASITHLDFLPDTVYLLNISSAADTAGNPLISGPAPNPWSFRTASLPLVASTAWQGGAWRLFSTPVSPVDNSGAVNLGDDLGTYGQSNWLMYGYQAATDSFVDRPALHNGQAYWLASVNSAGLDIYGYKEEGPRTVALQAGWNLVGCPFQEPVAVPMVEVIDSSGAIWAYNDTSNNFFVNDSLVRQRMWAYNDHTYDLVNNGGWDSLSAFDTSSHLMPWQGYAVYAARPCSLFMMPAFKSAGKGLMAAPQPEVLWQVELAASSGGAVDRGLRMGLSPQAKPGYDRLDAEKPPLVGNRVAASIPHPEWGGPCRSYHYDFRPPAEHIEWPLSVRVAGAEEPAQLSYRLSAPLPEGYGLYLADRQSGKVSRLDGSGQIGFNGSREFSVVYTNRGLEGLSLKPLRFDLNRAYPNPFSGSITVNYQLAQAGRVSLKVYNVAGQLVKTLAEGQALPGYYSRTWDGRDNAGRRISSGVYIIRLESAEGLATRKLIKIK